MVTLTEPVPGVVVQAPPDVVLLKVIDDELQTADAPLMAGGPTLVTVSVHTEVFVQPFTVY